MRGGGISRLGVMLFLFTLYWCTGVLVQCVLSQFHVFTWSVAIDVQLALVSFYHKL